MNLRRWMALYREIERDFSFSREREVQARDMLSAILGDDFLKLGDIGNLIGSDVYVVGASPNLEREVEVITESYPIISADEASVYLYEIGLTPTIVLTDLDGDVEKLAEIPAVFGIHAHGDNIHRLHLASRFIRRFGTTQIDPIWNVYNFGGFTDGDRCVFLSYYYGARIHMVGFDFDNPREKLGKDMSIKRKKLKWARRLINELQAEGASIIWESLK